MGQGRAAGSHCPTLAPNVPHTDLYVTGGHALLIDGVLVPAELLINGTTITRDDAREYDELEYFHVKLESHDVVYAEGAPAETLLDVNEFAVNFADYLRQYGTSTAEEARCAPLIHIWGRAPRIGVKNSAVLSPLGLICEIRLTYYAIAWKSGESCFLDNRSFPTRQSADGYWRRWLLPSPAPCASAFASRPAFQRSVRSPRIADARRPGVRLRAGPEFALELGCQCPVLGEAPFRACGD